MRKLRLLVLVTALGCGGGPPPPTVYNEHLLEAIQSAIEHKDARSLDQYANRARARRNAGQLTDERFESMGVVFQKARAGDWTGAAQATDALRR